MSSETHLYKKFDVRRNNGKKQDFIENRWTFAIEQTFSLTLLTIVNKTDMQLEEKLGQKEKEKIVYTQALSLQLIC